MNLDKAIKELEDENEQCYYQCEGHCSEIQNNICTCRDATILSELEQYRAIGTVEECREARKRHRVKDIIRNPGGEVDEDWLCPTCGKFCSPYAKHCQHCGQAVKVGDTP